MKPNGLLVMAFYLGNTWSILSLLLFIGLNEVRLICSALFVVKFNLKAAHKKVHIGTIVK